MLTTDMSQLQQYQQMLHHGMQQQPQQQQIGPPGIAEAQIYKTQVQDPNQLHAQRTPIQGMPRSDIWKNFDPSWLQQTQHPAEAQGAQILPASTG